MLRVSLGVVAALLFVAVAWSLAETTSVQRGYDGTGMALTLDKDVLEDQSAANVVPTALPAAVAEGPRAGAAYENVKVLGGISTGQFTRLMTSVTMWVSPEQGCAYCHNTENMASDEKYTKIVSRRMFQMVQHINADWQSHVKPAGVTCYTCHRGKPVPEYIWFDDVVGKQETRMVGARAGQNAPAETVGLASLPQDPFTPFLENAANIRIVGDTPLPTGNRRSIKQAEWTYGLMMHMSGALGVNCTYCHNSRAFAEWGQSPVARTTAWYGIRMVRDLNGEYLVPLKDTYPSYRLGPTGDAPKTNCTTCHQGVYKPLLGQNMLKDFMASLSGPTPYEAPPEPVKTATTADDGADVEDAAPADTEGTAPTEAVPPSGTPPPAGDSDANKPT